MCKEKVCKGCHETLPVDRFGRHKGRKDGLLSRCKECSRTHSLVCNHCGKNFLSYKKRTKHCSYECKFAALSAKVLITCEHCGKEQKRSPSQINSAHLFCSVSCKVSYYTLSETVSCKTCGQLFSKKLSQIRKSGNRHFCSRSCTAIGKRGTGGEGHPLWNPKKTQKERELDRKIPGYSTWRTDVYEKNKYTCQCCGKIGGDLNAHHILPYGEFPGLRLDVSNGITLCVPCHKAFHSEYGHTGNTQAQLDEFIASFNS